MALCKLRSNSLAITIELQTQPLAIDLAGATHLGVEMELKVDD